MNRVLPLCGGHRPTYATGIVALLRRKSDNRLLLRPAVPGELGEVFSVEELEELVMNSPPAQRALLQGGVFLVFSERERAQCTTAGDPDLFARTMVCDMAAPPFRFAAAASFGFSTCR